jgi:cell division protein FtsB
MKTKRPEAERDGDKPARKSRQSARNTARRSADAPPRRRKPTREQRPQRSAPATNPIPRPTERPARPKNASQAKARAKARKAKAPKVVRPPLRERILVKLSSVDLNPRTLVSRVPFVVLVIGSLGVGLGVTLWLSTDAAERSYQLSHARETNQALLQQKEALERQVLEAQAAPALAEAARNLGMIPSRDTAHLVQDAAGNWVVVGTPKPAEGVAPPPLNTPLPEAGPPRPPAPPAPRVVEPREVTVRMPPRGLPTPAPLPGVEPPAPLTPAAPLAVAPDAEVPHAIGTQPPALGPVQPPAEQPAAPLPGPAA